MSKEFEEIVLKKLDMLDDKITSTGTKLGSLEEKTTNTDSVIQEVVLKKLDNLETEMGNLKIEIKDTQEVVNYLNNNFTKFDYEINKKIDTLFDAYTTCKDTDATHAQNIVSLNTKTFNHDIRISNLENKVLTA